MADPTETADEGEQESLFETLKRWVIDDRRANSEWYTEMKPDFGFYEGGDAQWEAADISKMNEESKPHTTFNFIQPSINAVNGMEVSNRQEVTYLPRTTQTTPAQQTPAGVAPPGVAAQPPVPVPGADDTGPAEMYTAAGAYFRDECDAEDEESDAFQDTAICGMGWSETRVDFEDEPEGKIVIDRCDPGEMGWDARAVKRNLVDARRLHRVREIDRRAAMEMFPGYDPDEIDAAWARPQNIAQPHDREAARNYENDHGTKAERKLLTIVEVSWFDVLSTHRIADVKSGEILEDKSTEELKKIRERAKEAGVKIAVHTVKRKVYRYAFLGASGILGDDEQGTPCQSQKGFKWHCITGTRLRNKRQWCGIVRGMRDPQRWANALYSSTLHTLMTSGKGIMAERSAFEKPEQAEADWAQSGKIVWLNPGAISGSNPRVQQKVPTLLPPGIEKLMEFAIAAMRGVSGVNLETLGGVDRDQAASLEYQRRQAATMILAPFFDGLRRYRKNQGRVMLDLIRQYMSDGRLIRVVGPDYEQYLPLIRNDDVTEFDIIVAESPTSPNQKEATWATINQILPMVGKNLGPRTTTALLKASPLPTTVVKEFQDAAAQEQQAAASAPPPPEVQLKQLELQQRQQESVLDQKSKEADALVKAKHSEIEMQKLGMEAELRRLEAQVKLAELGLKEKELIVKSKELDVRAIEAQASMQQAQQPQPAAE